jgi:hypothetical protein
MNHLFAKNAILTQLDRTVKLTPMKSPSSDAAPTAARTRRFGWIAAALLANGCMIPFGGPPARVPPWPQNAVLLKVPPVRQEGRYLCGIAAAKMVEQYYGLEFSSATAAALFAEAKDHGATGGGLKKAFEDSGYYAEVFPGTLDHEVTGLYRYLDRGWPVIIMLGRPDVAAHYVVLIGYDDQDHRLAFLDPERGPIVDELEEFNRVWVQSRNFALLAVPNDKQSAAPR